MYQLIFTTNDNTRKTFAANVPEKDAEMIQERLSTVGGFTRFMVDVYDTQVTAKEYEGYGRFKSKKELLKWLHENVFMNDCKSLEEFTEEYRQILERYNDNTRLDNMAVDILYDDYLTGKDTVTVWKKIRGYVTCTMADYNCPRPSASRLRSFIRSAFVELALDK